MIKKSIIVLTIVTLLFSIPVLAQNNNDNGEKQTQTQSQNIAAVVNGEKIPMSELDQYAGIQQLVMTLYQRNQQFASVLLNSEEGKNLINKYKKQKLDELVKQKLMKQEAKERGLSVSQKEKEKRFQQHISQIKNRYKMSEDQLMQTLKKQGIKSLDQYKKMFLSNNANNMLISKLREDVVDKVEVSDKEIKEHYNKNKNMYKQEEQVKASHILVDTKEKAKEVKNKLNNGSNFKEMVKEYSTDKGSVENGGDVGYFKENGQMVSSFSKAAFKLNVGQISDPVKSQFGYHIIKVTDKKEAKTQTLEEVKNQIKQSIKKSRQSDVWNKFVKQLREEAEVKSNL